MYRIVYCSRNLIEGTALDRDAEISQILATSRQNNRRDNVTGALLFSSGFFAQVLEGPQAAVEQVFERLQRDERHGDVTVLEIAKAGHRDFPEWAMAHVQPPSQEQAAGIAAKLDLALLQPTSAGSEILDLLRGLVIQEE